MGVKGVAGGVDLPDGLVLLSQENGVGSAEQELGMMVFPCTDAEHEDHHCHRTLARREQQQEEVRDHTARKHVPELILVRGIGSVHLPFILLLHKQRNRQ